MKLCWLVILAIGASIAVGIAGGVGTYTFHYAKGASYMTDDPKACANCHIMHEQYDGWLRSSHRNVAVCNDCHTPKGYVAKYIVKADNGWHHSYAFTTGDFHEPIQIKERNRRVTEQACLKCHQDMAHAMTAGPEKLSCIRCHWDVGHP
jgi:cytochrome c nitrite reductase small subunit